MADEINNNDIYIHLEEYDSQDIIINSTLRVHLVRSDVGYIIDAYKDSETPEKLVDSGFINSLTIWEDDIEDVEEYDEEE